MTALPNPPPRVNAARLREQLERLSEFGRPAGGTFADGVSRLAYSSADLAARTYVAELMAGAHLDVRLDPAANLIGRRSGCTDSRAALVLGSHLDSVPDGGNFDGPLGTLAAIEVARSLADARLDTFHPLEIVVWTNEEGVAYGDGLFGSRAAAGAVEPHELERVWHGVRLSDALRALGGRPEHLAAARRPPGSVHAYLELHVEQGGVLERAGVPVGIVEGIVAIARHECVVRGVANHAGTTPLSDRRDALLAAARVVLAVREIAAGEPGRQVGTVGRLEVAPNAPNVVPGLVRLTVEFRDLSEATITRLAAALATRLPAIAEATGTQIDLRPTSHDPAAIADTRLREAIAASAAALGLAHLSLPSGAGHDAQMMARLGPMGMIFVPSVGGVSHAPHERTSWEDCAHGADVLLRTALAVDRMNMRR